MKPLRCIIPASYQFLFAATAVAANHTISRFSTRGSIDYSLVYHDKDRDKPSILQIIYSNHIKQSVASEKITKARRKQFSGLSDIEIDKMFDDCVREYHVIKAHVAMTRCAI